MLDRDRYREYIKNCQQARHEPIGDEMQAKTEALAVRMIRREFKVSLKLAKSMVQEAREHGHRHTEWSGGKIVYSIDYRDGVWSI